MHDARREADAAHHAKTRFLAVISHEIRTPLNAIIGMADLLWETPLAPEQRQYVRMFRNAGEDLLRLINDILDLTHMDSGRFELENIPFDLVRVLEDACEVMALPAHRKHLELTYRVAPDVPTNLTGDPARLRQILINLINNAIKFTERGMVTIEVTCGAVARRAAKTSTLLFAVTDTGIGIPADRLHSVFERFAQVDASSTRKYGGIGLGLAIARELVRRMHGRIQVQSTVGAGTTFSFTARCGRGDATGQPHRAPVPHLAGIRVLITDDNDINRMILREMLTHAGLVVTEAASGDAALAAIAAAHQAGTPFAVLLLDYHMPGMDGHTVLETVRQRWGTAHTVIMMLTSEDQQHSRMLGALWVMKPVRQAALIDTLARALADTPAPHHAESAPPRATPMLAPLRILLADDAADNRLLVEHHLKGHRLEMVDDGAAAVARATTAQYDVILMDMSMPVMDGLTATRHIRAWERATATPPTPIIALTAHAYHDEIRASISAGCNAHLTKPFRKDDLQQALVACGAGTLAGHAAGAGIGTGADAGAAAVPLRIPDEVRELAPAFLERRRQDVVALRAALADGQLAVIERIGHMLKGSGGSYGFDWITSIGAQLERAAHAADETTIVSEIDTLTRYLAQVTLTHE
ncbi:MAG: response regulator [bacterium]|nr:response regulator [bacterium]